jgi:tetratricopeptide (TPR) repeat protein
MFAWAWSGPAVAQELGTIDFPNSGAPGAQAPFIEGVKALHSFQFDEAGVAFRAAQQADPDFALAYWGEAMSYNHPLWAEQDTAAARAALETLAAELDGRLAAARLDKEKALLEAAELLFYGPADKLERDVAYSEAMARAHARWPEDHEIATFYALSLLGTVRPGDTGFRRQAQAAAIAMEVFAENPEHPGAAHFIIHSFDDPEHAPLALPAARVYASIAPSATHALHMPSHIFVQLGMWEEVVDSNVEAYRAAVEVNERLNLPEGRSDFHSLSWLTYANLMLGRFDAAKANVELARQAAERNPGNAGVQNGYLGMRARYMLETEQWEAIPVDGAHADRPAGSTPGIPMARDGGDAWLFAAGISAAKRGDVASADSAAAALESRRARTEAQGNTYGAKAQAILASEVEALAELARGRHDAAVKAAEHAAQIELTMAAPSGPPEPIKPALELHGEILFAAGRAAEAVAAFEQSLLRTPRRTPSLLGLARAAAAAGDSSKARQAYTEIASTSGAAATSAALREARDFLASATR